MSHSPNYAWLAYEPFNYPSELRHAINTARELLETVSEIRKDASTALDVGQAFDWKATLERLYAVQSTAFPCIEAVLGHARQVGSAVEAAGSFAPCWFALVKAIVKDTERALDDEAAIARHKMPPPVAEQWRSAHNDGESMKPIRRADQKRIIAGVEAEAGKILGQFPCEYPIPAPMFADEAESDVERHGAERIGETGGEAVAGSEGGNESTADEQPEQRFSELREWAADKLKGNQRKAVEMVIDGDGACPIADIAAQVEWSLPYDNAFNSCRREINKKIKKRGWQLYRHDNRACLAEIGQE